MNCIICLLPAFIGPRGPHLRVHLSGYLTHRIARSLFLLPQKIQRVLSSPQREQQRYLSTFLSRSRRRRRRRRNAARSHALVNIVNQQDLTLKMDRELGGSGGFFYSRVKIRRMK